MGLDSASGGPREISSEELREIVNAACEDLDVEDLTVKKAGHVLKEVTDILDHTKEYKKEGVERLRKSRVMVVDDLSGEIMKIYPYLVAATGGNASYICYLEQGVDELCRQIGEDNPDVVLMDYQLEGKTVTGDEVVRKLVETRPDIKCMGFSKDLDCNIRMCDAGAIGFLDKKYSCGVPYQIGCIAALLEPNMNAGEG